MIGWLEVRIMMGKDAARSTQHAARSTQHAARSTQHAARSTQHAARSTKLLLFAAAAAVGLAVGCNQKDVARTGVYDGQNPIGPAEAYGTYDPNVPGHLRAYTTVDTFNVHGSESLAADLEKLFGGVSGSFELIINPDQASVPQGCTAGTGHICLVAADHDPNATVYPWDQNVSPAVDVSPLVGGPLGLALTVGSFSLDLTSFLPNTSQVDPTGFSGILSDLVAPTTNVRALGKVDTAGIMIGYGAALPAVQDTQVAGDLGLWIPIEVSIQNATTRNNECYAVSGGGTIEPCSLVDHDIDQAGCSGVAFKDRVSRMRFYIGFIPSQTPNCHPLANDPATAWMAKVPDGVNYDQPCLTVKTDVTAGLTLGDLGSGSDVEFGGVNLENCEFDIDVACAALHLVGTSCEDLVEQYVLQDAESALSTAAPQLRTSLLNALDVTSLNSDGSVFSESPPCTANSPSSCFTMNLSYYSELALGNLAEVGYGFFANPFINPAHPSRHYPIVKVSPDIECEDQGTTTVEVSPGKWMCDECITDQSTTCPYDSNGNCTNCVGNPKGVIQVDPEDVAVRFDIAVDSDGDGIDNFDDDCPNNPDPMQQDTDNDGIGDACDPCPTNPDTTLTDPDGDHLCGAEDNCPDVWNEDQADCNKDAEDELGIPERGDACDPVPCASASAETGPEVNSFDSACTLGDQSACVYQSDDFIVWHGVQDKSTPLNSPASAGVTEFAHCECAAASSAIGQQQSIAACRTGTSGNALCTIANRHSYPSDALQGMAPDGSNWVGMTTERLTPDCLSTNTCQPVFHDQIASAYESQYGGIDAPIETALWRPDLDLDLLIPNTPIPTEDVLKLASAQFGGFTWAHTRQFAQKDLDTEALSPPSPIRPDADWSDAASHYFLQNGVIYKPIPFPPGCFPGGCGFSAYTDQICLACSLHRFPDWLVDNGNVIVELNPRLSIDVTASVDSTLLAALRNPALAVVPVSEPASILAAQQNPLRAIAVNRAALTSPGYIADTPNGVTGFGNARITNFDVDPPHVFAASATTGAAYAVGGDGHSESLTLIPIGGGPNTTLPITGVDTDGTPLSVAYRYVDGQLYLLDEEHSAWWSSIRILRIDPNTGDATLLSETPSLRTQAAMYLSVDNSGRLLVAGAANHDSTLFTRFEPDEHGLRFRGWLIQDGTLLAPPDTRGDTAYSVIMQKGRGGEPVALEIDASSFRGPSEEAYGHGQSAEHGRDDHGGHSGSGDHGHGDHDQPPGHGGHDQYGLPPWY
jgi:hypothetical protein